MPLRIGFDLDGVLADMDGELLSQARQLFGDRVLLKSPKAQRPAPDAQAPAAVAADESDDAQDDRDISASPDADAVPHDPPPPALRLTSKQQRRLWRHVESIDDFWETLKETEPGIVARLAALATQQRWEIIFLTKRPEGAGATAQVQTQRWLASKGFALPSVFVVQGSRGRIAAALGLDVVVDDRPENCLDVVVDSKARAVLVWREDVTLLPLGARRLGIGVVGTVGECLDILMQVDAAVQERPGVIDRVMRLLGLKEPASVQG